MTNIIKVLSLDTFEKKLPELEIETGFYSALPKFLRFGDYLFTTQGYCEMLAHLAEEASRTTSSIFTYPSEILESAHHNILCMLN